MSNSRTTPLRVAVLASGRGSNLQAIIDAIEAGQVQAQIVAVLSNKREAVALERARKHGLTDIFVDPKPFAGRPDSREAYDRALLEILQQHDVELVLLAGYMKIVTAVLVNAYANRMMNIHPSLLPSFPGLDVQKKAIDWGCKLAGCTVHFVTEGVDEGPIIIQAAVPILDADTSETLAARILLQEHKIYPRAVQLFAEGRLQVDSRRVVIDAAKPDGEAIISAV
ncbi:MAG: phosphoribosylglycinamide formyltransferase [Nitrospira sp. UW-LDO-01]|uniref:Phosphoribosylglycinamide formyltransferase n=1 Tax=Candidatus Nitrospira nitrosa TaxID=1742972 RepID=A0A0S4LIM1_9BACT|nr:phosphoribosylglycinamide formyltransferase [Candidatus Nitrospira nitrosa]OYT21423.1 MAG: phosphoribosylglycinamide formyltransferase [Nitrospira sp. UW-LDO-01]CUS37447.1 phosphoribosylglycinamide formyltransferase 1 [Candidatus Nitrospira nitrosa]